MLYLMVISLNFLSWWISVLFPSTKKYEKKLNIWFVHLQVIFDQSPTSEKLELENLFLSLNSWNLNLKSKRVHLPRSCQKKPVLSPPGGEMKNEEGWAVFCPHRKQKEVHREVQKAKKKQQSDKRGKENAWMLKLGEVC